MLQSRRTETSGDVFAGPSQMAAIMREFDWAFTPLGPVETWSPALKAMTRMLLANSFPIILWWGPDFIQLYNDAYVPVLGKKHPHASLGRPFRECWSEVFHILGPLAQIPFEGGPATWMDAIPVQLNRYGFWEEAHFTISYSPVPDTEASRGIGGVIGIINEISAKIVADRRILALRDLGSRFTEPQTVEEACVNAANILAAYDKDVPFALLYLIDEKGKFANLAGRAPSAADEPETGNDPAFCPSLIELGDDAASWPLIAAMQREDLVLVDDLSRRFRHIPPGPWPDPPARAAVVPIKSSLAHQFVGFLVVGISSRLQFDDSYRGFLELAAAQIATVIGNARAAEAERKRIEALAEIDRAKTAFFSNVSHEFRTPLTLILGPLQDMIAQPGNYSAADRERLELAHRNSLRLLKLVNSLLDFSRIEAGRIQACYEPVDLSVLTASLASVFRSLAERAGLRLIVDCPPLAEPVYIDREMWEKIVFNLLSNAFKFTFAGEIRVSTCSLGDAAEVVVADTGTGIPAEELPELFKRFHRVRGARSRSYEGSGIGLALVQELVRLHGGSIRIESEMNHGSRFIISLPYGNAHLASGRIGTAREQSSTMVVADAYLHEAERWLAGEQKAGSGQAGAVALSDPGNSELILIADDNADMRDYVAHLLEPKYRVQAVGDGAQAIEAIEKLHPDLVLTDAMMPVLDGFAVLRAVRSHPDLSATPVILLSARAGEEAKAEGLETGADDYMVKPFAAHDLQVRVASHLALARLRRDVQSEIRQSEERFRALVAASSDAVYQMSADWRIMRHLVGRHFIADTESPDQSWLERYIPLDDQPVVTAAIAHAIETKSVFALEHRVLRADGALGWTFSRAVPILDTQGEIVEWFGMATDITARKQAEEALLRSERLASLGRMAATISHEINNPLEALTNLLFLASHAEGLPAIARERLDEADTELRRIAHITRQSLGFYRESSAPALTNLNDVVESTIELLKGKIRARQVTVERQWRSEQPITAVAGELRQVFSNLLANSLDAVDDGGIVKVRTSSCMLRDGRRGVRITVADNGKGIEPQARKHVFEPLYTTKGVIGTGLGLWVSRQIVEKHRGFIRMRSRQTGAHKGSTFSVLLPV